jgi:regulatory protein
MTSSPPRRIDGIEPLDTDPERVRLLLSDGETLTAPRTQVREAGLAVGDRLSPALRSALESEDLAWSAREAALSLLSYRPRSRGELARRLSRKGFPEPVVTACLDTLEARGLVDDRSFAEALVRDRIRLTHRGRARILAELARKGVSSPVAEAAVETVYREEELSDAHMAEDAALAWLRRQRPAVHHALAEGGFGDASRAARRRLLGYLGRRGFRGGTAIRALEVAREEARDPEGPG